MKLELYSERLHLCPFDLSDVDLDVEMATEPDVMKSFGGVVTEQQAVAETITSHGAAAVGASGYGPSLAD